MKFMSNAPIDDGNVANASVAAVPADIKTVARPLSFPRLHSGFFLALTANLLWGTSFLASKYTLIFWGPFTASALRFALALIAMGIFFPMFGIKIRLPRNRIEWLHIFLVGFTGFGALYPLQLSGMNHISSALSAAIMLTSPLLLILLGAIFLKEKLSSRKIVALGLGIIGGVFLVTHGGSLQELINGPKNIFVGSLLTFGASLSLALSVIGTRKASKTIEAPTLTFWSILLGLWMIVPFSIFENAVNPSTLSGNGNKGLAIFSLLYLALICSALCFLLWNRAIAKASPKELASTMHIKTPVAILLGTLVAGESFQVFQIVGAVVVAIGVALSQTEKKRVVLQS